MIKIIKTDLDSTVIDSIAYVNKRKSEQGSVLLVKFTNGKVYNNMSTNILLINVFFK